jgi:hypothetical protein
VLRYDFSVHFGVASCDYTSPNRINIMQLRRHFNLLTLRSLLILVPFFQTFLIITFAFACFDCHLFTCIMTFDLTFTYESILTAAFVSFAPHLRRLLCRSFARHRFVLQIRVVNAFRSGLDGQRPPHALIRRAAAMKSASLDAQSHLNDFKVGGQFARLNKLAHSLSLEESRRRQQLAEAAARPSAAPASNASSAGSTSTNPAATGHLPKNGGSINEQAETSFEKTTSVETAV